jgi:metal-dependent hydrolase (beta-lactamase superfamily II)
MPVAINFIKALHGDAVLLKVSQANSTLNVLIDGGPTAAFRPRKPGFPGDAELKAALGEIRTKGQIIDLLVMTHVDDDHIGGIIAGFEHPDYLPTLTKSVIFNSGQLINQYLNLPAQPSNNIKGNFLNSNKTSIKQGVTLESFLSAKKIWVKKVFKQGDEHTVENIKFFFLSPNEENLKSLSGKWEKERKSPKTAKKATDYAKSYKDLLLDKSKKSDNSVHNGSSLSFFVEIDGAKILLLGDAFSETTEEGLEKLGHSETNPLIVDLVKISHHGSHKNTSLKFLKMIRSENFVITTDGSQHGLPDKLTIARIHETHPTATVHFNYPELITKIFSPHEILDLGNRIKGIAGDIVIE